MHEAKQSVGAACRTARSRARLSRSAAPDFPFATTHTPSAVNSVVSVRSAGRATTARRRAAVVARAKGDADQVGARQQHQRDDPPSAARPPPGGIPGELDEGATCWTTHDPDARSMATISMAWATAQTKPPTATTTVTTASQTYTACFTKAACHRGEAAAQTWMPGQAATCG